jgi:myo-inositol-1(or 4)-monophosphatase
MDLDEELAVAEEAVCEAGSVITQLYTGRYDVREKSKGNPVTSADLEANAVIHERITRRFPKDAWLSEEDPDDLRRLNVHRVWVVDPLDGTREFIQGVPEFCVSIGLVVDGYPVLGVIYNPLTKELFKAAEGHGAKVNDQPLRIAMGSEIKGACLLVSRSEPRRKYEELAKTFKLETMGSIAYRMASVALGRADATVTFRRVNEWDVCGGTVIVEQAGGLVIDGEGKRLVFNRREPLVRRLVGGRCILTREVQKMLG